MKLIGKLSIALLVGITGLQAVHAVEQGVTDKEILLGVSNVQSGQSAGAGEQTNVGIKALVNTVNNEGGINGRLIKLLVKDDKYEPEQAIACFKTLLADGMFGLTGIYGSVCSARYIPMCEQNKVPVAGFYPGTFFIGDPVKHYVFSIRASYRDEMKEAVEHLWNDAGMRRFAIIYQNDAFGADCLEGVKATLAKHHAELIGMASYTRNKSDISEAVKDIKEKNPQVVFLGAVYTPCTEVVKLAHQSKWSPLFVMNSGTSVELFRDEAGPDADGALFTEVVPPPKSDLPLVSQYLKALKQFFPNEKPGYCSLRGYMDALLWVEGLKRCGKNVTRENFVSSLEKIHHLDIGLGKGMELNYSPTDHLGFHKVFFGTFKNGQIASFDQWKSLAKK